MVFRTRHKLKNGKSVFAKRNKKGQFVDIQNIGKSLKRDRRIKAKTKVKSGQGFRGDLKRKPKPTSLELVPRTLNKPVGPPQFKRGRGDQTFFKVFKR